MIFDTHTHYDDKAFDNDRDSLLKGMESHYIEAIVNIGASIQTSKNTLQLTKEYPNVYGAIGVHPSESSELNDAMVEWIKAASSNEKIVAIGEIGLDYYWDTPQRELQKYWFVRQLDIARQVKLPIVIHSRDAAKDTLDILKAERADDMGGVIHCFSYGLDMAKEYLGMGFYLGIGGVLTFNNAKKLKEVVEYMPLDRIVLETDSPYLSPVPRRGERNSSYNLSYVIESISKIKAKSREDIITITNTNAKKLYHLTTH